MTHNYCAVMLPVLHTSDIFLKSWLAKIVRLKGSTVVFRLGSKLMYRKCGLKILAGAVVLALAGTAVANTSIDAATTGDLFLNIVDTTSNTSFLYDTGVSQASFNGASTYSFNLAVDPNLSGFLHGKDTFNYSIISATKSGIASIVDFTGGANAAAPTPVAPSAFLVNQVQAPISQFLTFANSVASTSATSAVIPTGSSEQGFWGSAAEQSLSAKFFKLSNLPYGDNAALGTPLSFFQAIGTTLTTYASTWNFTAANDMLTYGSGTGGGGPPPPVPLPAPLILLVSALGLMGVSAHRRKFTA